MSAGIHPDVRDFSRVYEFYAEYAHVVDDDLLETWADLFTEDATYRVTTRENYDRGLPLAAIYCDGRAMMSDRMSAMRTANIYEPHVYCHSMSAIRIIARNGHGWRTRSNLTVIRTMAEGDMMVFASGRTFDTITEEGGRLKFAERLVVLDSRSIDTLLVIPL